MKILEKYSVAKHGIVINAMRNAAQFLIGVSLFYLISGSIDIITMVFGLLAFLVCYSAVYPFNDLMDLEQDIKDGRRWKALVRGEMQKKDSISLVFLLLILGIFFLAFTNLMFTILIFFLLLSNFFHSTHYIEVKEKVLPLTSNMFFMQFLKFSSGWVALASGFSGLPLYLILTFSGFYTIFYLFYKGKLLKSSNLGERIFTVGLVTFTVFLFIVSFFSYNFKLPLLVLLSFSIIIYLLWRWPQQKIDLSGQRSKMQGTIVAMSAIAILSFFVLSLPEVASANEKLDERLDRGLEEYRDNISDRIPENVKERISYFTNQTEISKNLILRRIDLPEKIE